MKATLDLPEELAARLRVRAAQDGRAVQEVAVGLLVDALGEPAGDDTAAQPLPRHLPVIPARPLGGAASAATLTPQQMSDAIKAAEQQHEVERFEKTSGHQHVDRAHP